MLRQRSASRSGAVYIRVLPRMQKSHRGWAWRACKCSGTTTALALSSGGHLARLVMVRGNREPVPDRKLGFRERPISKHAVTAALLYGPTAPVPPWVPVGIMQANVVPEDLAFDLYLCA